MIRPRRGATAAPATAAAVVALLLAGCAGASSDDGSGSGDGAGSEASGSPSSGGEARPLTPVASAEALEYCPDIGAGPLDGEVGGVEAVYLCTAELLADVDTPGGERSYETVERLVDPAAVLEVYATPDAEPTDGMCTRQFEDPRILWLDLGDEIVAVRAPVDPCGFPLDAATAAVDDAERETVLEIGTKPTDTIVPHPGRED